MSGIFSVAEKENALLVSAATTKQQKTPLPAVLSKTNIKGFASEVRFENQVFR